MAHVADVIKYEGDNTTFVWKYPCTDFNSYSQLIVHESQEAILFLNGEALDLFGPGRHTLQTQNIPKIGKLINRTTDGETPFHCEVYFVNKTEQMAIKWGTDSHVQFMEPTYGFPLSVGASGEMSLRVSNSRKLLMKLVGTEMLLDPKKLVGFFRAFLMARVKPYIAQFMQSTSVSIFELDAHMSEFSQAIKTQLQPDFAAYGVSLEQFFVTNVVRPDGEEKYEKFKELHFRQYADIAEAKLRQQTDLIYAQTEAQKTVVDQEPENGRAYLGKLMAELQVRKEENLVRLEAPFDDRPLYEKSLRFGDAALASLLKQSNQTIRNRIQAEKEAAEQQERERQEKARREAEAEKQRKEEARLEKERKRLRAQQERKEKRAATEKQRKKLLRWLLPTVAAVLILAAAGIGLTKWKEAKEAAALEAERSAIQRAEAEAAAQAAAELSAQQERYAAAVALLEEKRFEEAIAAFTELDGFEDSEAKLSVAQIGLKMEDDYNAAAAAMEAGDYEAAMEMWAQLGDHLDCPEQYAICGVELAREKFRACIDGVETVDYAAAAENLEAMTAYDTDLAIRYRDDGYYELAELAFAAEESEEASAYLALVSAAARFDGYEALQTEIDRLNLYHQAEAITLTNGETRKQLVGLLDQLPSDYREVAALRQKVAEYDKAVAEAEAARKAAEEEAARKAAEEEKKAAEQAVIAEYTFKLMGTWKGTWAYDFNSDGTFLEYEYNDYCIRRKGTYFLTVKDIENEIFYLHLSVTDEDAKKYKGRSARWPIQFISDNIIMITIEETWTFQR